MRGINDTSSETTEEMRFELAFKEAIKNRDVGKIKALLKKDVDPNCLNNDDFRNVVEAGEIEIIKLLIQARLNIHKNEEFALRLAAESGETEVTELLLQAGADPSARSSTAARWAHQNNHPKTTGIILKYSSPSQLKELLKKKKNAPLRSEESAPKDEFGKDALDQKVEQEIQRKLTVKAKKTTSQEPTLEI